jgi:hypothetical protein
MKACVPPVDLSEIFTLANTYLKLKIAPGNGLGSTFVTAADNVDKKEWQKRRYNSQREEVPEKTQEQGKKNAEAEKNEKKQCAPHLPS